MTFARQSFSTRRGGMLVGLLFCTLAGHAVGARPLGIDVSYWQGNLSQTTWDNVYAAGRTFAFIRCAHYGVGGGDPDPYFASNMTRARNAGLLCGAYHFARPTIRDPQTEANYFVNYATQYWTSWTQYGPNFISSGFLRPVLDLEEGGGATPVGAANLSAWANAWLDAVTLATGIEPMVYCNSNYAKNYLNSTLASRTLWIANYSCSIDPQTASPPSGIGIWSNWVFWQYCSSLSVAGISPVDMNVFNGTPAQLQSYLIGGNIAPVISSVQAGSLTNAGATITWTTDSASSSQVEYGLTSAYGSTSPLDSTAVTAHSVALSGLAANTLYHYRVFSTNAYGTSASSDYTFTTSGPPTISSVQATSITNSTATITWTTNAPSTSRVSYGPTSGYGSQTTLDSTLTTSHAVNLSGLQSNATYHYQALSTNSYGAAQSTDATFTTIGTVPDIVVDNTDANCTVTGSWATATASAHIGTNYIFASGAGSGNTSEASATAKTRWTPNLSAAGNWNVYIYYASGTNRSTNTYWKVVNAGTTLTLRVNQQLLGNAYTLLASNVTFNSGSTGYVEAMNNTGDGAILQVDAVKWVYKGAVADTQPPTVPTGLIATAASSGSIQLNWTASTDNVGVAGYKVYRGGSYLASVAGASYLDTGLTANTSYGYQVSAYDAASPAVNESAQAAVVNRATLSIAPSVSNVTCERTAGSWYPTDGFAFTPVGGFGAGTLTRYLYAWDNTATHTWTGSETLWTAGVLSLNAASASLRYLHVQGYNLDGVANGSLDLGPWQFDGSAPATPVVTDDGSMTSNFASLHAAWTAADAQSGILKIEYRIRTGAGSVVRDWTDVGTAASVTASGLALASREMYFFDVRATNRAGTLSATGASDGILAFPYDMNNSGEVGTLDFVYFQACVQGADVPYPTGLAHDCGRLDGDVDGDVDVSDYGAFQTCYGPNDAACLPQ